MTNAQPPDDPIKVSRRENPLTQGARYGLTGCSGCVVFIAAGLFVLLLLVILLGRS